MGINGETTIEEALKIMSHLPEEKLRQLVTIVSAYHCTFLNDKYEGLIEYVNKEKLAELWWINGDYQCIDNIYYCSFCFPGDSSKIIQERDKMFSTSWLLL